MSNLIFHNYYDESFDSNKKYNLCGFDLDYTIIKTKSGNVFPKNNNDWLILYPEVKTKLMQLKNNSNNIIVIFSNQRNLKVTIEEYMHKINMIHKELGVDFIFIASTEHDIFRKPSIGMYRYIKQELGIKFNKATSFYVGDMAGRKNDKYDTDRKFALNLKIPFYTPEEYFLGKEEESYTLYGYKLDNNMITNIGNISSPFIIISGYPSSGKSYLANKIKQNYNYEIISKDIYGSKFNKKLQDTLEKNIPTIVEGLYPNNNSRMALKEIAKKYNITNIHYIHVATNYDLSYHMNLYRTYFENKRIIPEIVYMKYRKDFEEININDWMIFSTYYPTIDTKINKYYL